MKKVLFLALLSSTMMFAQSKDATAVIKSADKIAQTATKAAKTTSGGVATVYGDLKDGTSTIYTDMKDGIKALTPEARDLLEKTAAKLEKTTDQLWDILVRQQRVWSLCYLLLTVSSIMMWFRFFSLYKSMTTELNEAGEIKTFNVIITVLVGILSIIMSILSATHFIDMMTGFFNPEFGAMKNIYQVYKSIR